MTVVTSKKSSTRRASICAAQGTRSGRLRVESLEYTHAVRRVGEGEVLALHIGVEETAEEGGDDTSLGDAFGLPVE